MHISYEYIWKIVYWLLYFISTTTTTVLPPYAVLWQREYL